MSPASGQPRIVRHARKKIRTVLHGLRPSGLYGRFAAPAVLLNSIPKAGTHLLETALERYPRMRNAGLRTVSSWTTVPDRVTDRIRRVGKGEFLNAHVPAVPELIRIVHEREIRVLFMVRDPRDVVVSHFKYVCNIDTDHRLSAHYRSLPDDDARLMASIVGVDGLKPSIGEILDEFAGWMAADTSLLCRFEDLIGPEGGGSREAQHEVLRAVGQHLDIPVTGDEIARIAEGIFSPRSSTFRKGRLGVWREHFNAQHIAKFKEVAGTAIVRYGYERDLDW